MGNAQDSKGNNRKITMSGLNSYSQCALCGLNILSGQFHVCQAKDRLDGSLLESVVPGRLESPMLLNPGRSRDAILDEIEKALNEKIERMEREAADMALESEYGQASRIASEASGVSKAWFIVKRIIERQHSSQHEAE